MLCENLDAPEQAAQIAAKLEQALAQPLDFNGQVQPIRARVGFALFPRDAADAGGLMAAADAAMYRAKQRNRGA